MFGRRSFGDDWSADWSAAWNQPTSDSTVQTSGGDVPYYLAAPEQSGSVYTPQTQQPSTASQQVAEGSAVGASDWFKLASQTVGGLVNIFGQPVRPPVAPQPPPQPGIPLLAWVAIGVGGVVVLGVLARSLRKKSSTAGYRRHRRSRR